MAFNKEDFWFDGQKWLFIAKMHYEDLYRLKESLEKKGYRSLKIEKEIERRDELGFMDDNTVIKWNRCTEIATEFTNPCIEIMLGEPKTNAIQLETETEIKEYNFD
jgi:hypothetical protein